MIQAPYVNNGQYAYRVDKIYKIWFSQNKHNFMGATNMYRLIQLREKHPDKDIALVYCSSILTTNALLELKAFCLKINIKAVDLCDEIKQWVQNSLNENDLRLYDYAILEISKYATDQGGNLGAASDIVRMIQVVIESLGIYSDFDVKVSLNHLPADRLFYERAPYLFFLRTNDLSSYNNEVLMFSICSLDVRKLSFKSEEKLNHIQTAILNGYKSPALHLCVRYSLNQYHIQQTKSQQIKIRDLYERLAIDGIFSIRCSLNELSVGQILMTLPLMEQYLVLGDVAFQDNSSQKLLAFYNYILQNDPRMDWSVFQEYIQSYLLIFRRNLYMDTVIEISGPKALLKAIEAEYSIQFHDEFIPPILVTKEHEAGISVQLISADGTDHWPAVRQCALNESVFKDCFYTNNFCSQQSVCNPNIQIGDRGDQSWSEEGRENLSIKDDALNVSVKTIQKHILSYNAFRLKENLSKERKNQQNINIAFSARLETFKK